MDIITSAPWGKNSHSGNNGANCADVAPWRKSSYSTNEGDNCVEVAPWRKASYSGGNGGACVEAGVAARGHVLIRDTTNRDGAVLDIPAEAWDHFTAALK
jgi:Domain of unknown function (DUF397)